MEVKSGSGALNPALGECPAYGLTSGVFWVVFKLLQRGDWVF